MLWKIVTGKKEKNHHEILKITDFLAISGISTGRISLRLGWGWGGKAADVHEVSPDA